MTVATRATKKPVNGEKRGKTPAQATVKTTAKSTEVAKVPQPHGGALNAGGTPGNKGGGRKPEWLKEFCDDLLADSKCKAQVEAILQDKTHPAFATMWSKVADRAHGRPKESHEHSVSGSLELLLSGAHKLTP